MTDIKDMVSGERLKKFPGESWNEIRRRVLLPPTIADPGQQMVPQPFVPILNASGVQIPKGGVMMPNASMLGTSDIVTEYQPGLEVVAPVLSSGAEHLYLIATIPIPPDGTSFTGTGGAINSGYVWARVNIRDTTDKYAQVIDGDVTKLESTAITSRARIIDKQSGTGEKWALVFLAGARSRWFKGKTKTSTPITAGGSALVDTYVGGADTGEDFTATLDWVHGGEGIDEELELTAVEFESDNHFEVIQANCNPDAEAAAAPGHGDNFEASTTQTQAGATSVFRVTRVTVCDNDYDSVKLKEAELNDHNYVDNDTDNILRVWPRTDNRFPHHGPDAHTDIPARTAVDFQCPRANVWADPRAWDTAGRTFDGTDDYVSLADASLPTGMTSGDWTMHLDVLTPCTANSKWVINHGNGTSRLYIGTDSSGDLLVGTTSGWVLPGTTAMQTGRYLIQHDTAETGFNRWKIYFNGTLQTNTTNATHTDIVDGTDNFEIGRRNTSTQYADMQLRDFRFWTALKTWSDMLAEDGDDLEIWWHMNDATGATSCRDYTSNLRNGTYNGSMVRYEP